MTFVLTQMIISMTFVIMRLYNSILSARNDFFNSSCFAGSRFFKTPKTRADFLSKRRSIAPEREFLARVVDFRFRL